MTDPISDMITRIRNAVTAKHTRVDMPASKLKAEIARILQDEGYIQGFRIVEEAAEKEGRQARQVIRVFLKYGPHGEKVSSPFVNVAPCVGCEPCSMPRADTARAEVGGDPRRGGGSAFHPGRLP